MARLKDTTVVGALTIREATNDNEVVTKKYVDDILVLPENQNAGIVQLNNTNNGTVDELKIGSIPTQYISPNLFDFYNMPILGEFSSHTVSGEDISATINVDYNGRIYWVIPNKLVKGKQLTASMNVKSFETPGSTTTDIALYIREANFAATIASSNISKGIVSVAFTYNGDLDLMFLVYRAIGRAWESKITFNMPMLNEGPTALPYEPYTEKPSPENPVPIQTGNRVGKNIFDFDSMMSESVNVVRGKIDTNFENKSFTLTATAADCYTNNIPVYSMTRPLPVKEKTNYTFSYATDSTNNGSIYIAFLNELKELLPSSAYITIWNESGIRSKTFITPIGTKYVTVRFGVTYINQSLTYSEIMLNEGTLALPYEPFIENTVNMLPIFYPQTRTTSGVTMTVNPDRSITLNGTATGKLVIYLNEPRAKTFIYPQGEQFVLTNKSLFPDGSLFELAIAYTDGTFGWFTVNSSKTAQWLTLPKDTKTLNYYIIVYAGTTINNYTCYPMLTHGTRARPYEPYNNKQTSTIDIVSVGNNYLSLPNVSSTLKGITASITNGLLSVKGTRTEVGDFFFYRLVNHAPISLLAKTNYTISLDLNWGPYGGNWGIQFVDEFKKEILYLDKPTIMKKFTFSLDRPAVYYCFHVYCAGGVPGYPIGSVYDTSTNVMLNIGTTPLPYEPFVDSIKTSIPLETVGDEVDPSKPMELLGVYNTKTNILEQQWGKKHLEGSAFNEYTAWEKENTRTYLAWNVWGEYHFPIMTNNLLCSMFEYQFINFDDKPCFWSNPESNTPYIAVRIQKTIAPTVEAFQIWWDKNNPEIYYELSEFVPKTSKTFNIKPLTFEQTPKTLSPSTTLYPINNPSLITFNITDLAVGGNRINSILKDPDGINQMPYTTSEQVETDSQTGLTLDRTLARIDSDIETEAVNRKTADDGLRKKLSRGDIVGRDVSNAVANGLIYKNLMILAKGFNTYEGFNVQRGTGITTGTWNLPIYAKEIFVSGSSNGKGFAWSLDGKAWNYGTGITDGDWTMSFYANGIFVCGSDINRGFAWSLDGKAWNYGTGITDGNWDILTYANGIFLASSADSFAWSSDGKLWTRGTGGFGGGSVIYEKSLFVSSKNTGFAWSVDGKTWTAGTGVTSGNWRIPVYGNGIFVSSGSNGFAWSVDGKAWTAATGAGVGNPNWDTPIFANGIFVSGTIAIAYKYILWSVDGKTWTAGTGLPEYQGFQTPIFANGIFVSINFAVGSAWSADGKAWAGGSGASRPGTSRPIHSNGIIVAGNADNGFVWSFDGVKWKYGTGITGGNWKTPMSANGIFVSVSSGGGFSYALPTNDRKIDELLEFN